MIIHHLRKIVTIYYVFIAYIKVEVIPTKARSIGRISWEYTVVKVLYAL